MAIIKLPCNYIIECAVDGNVILKETRVSEKGTYYQNVVGYYSKVSSAIKRLADIMTADTEEEFTLKEYLDRYQSILETLTRSINNI